METKYANKNALFIATYSKARIPHTSRQASKFQRGLGLAYKVSTKQIEVLKDNSGNFVRIIN